VSYFRHQAREYAEFRPDYPEELFQFAASLVRRHDLAWDCATGSGQAATQLAKYFARVIATDISAEQIANAHAHAGVEYRVAPAECSGLPDAAANLITVCQALHWLDRPRFFAEARRVLAPGGALIATVYGDAQVAGDERLDAMLQRFNKQTMGEYWPLNRGLVDELYAGIEFPFRLLPAPQLTMTKQWTRAQLAGYLRSWSATARYVQRHGKDPVANFEREMQHGWNEACERREIRWPFRIFAGRVE
jgi:ubiquinone/menaquinone biosynthesis C-methylase UbiE